MEKLVTFCIAAYNVQSVIARCLDSFLEPRVLDLMEVLIINDGSTDDTPRIAEEYCKRFSHTFFLINKENGGHGSAINDAVHRARGRYFKPIDGDDGVLQENLALVLQKLQTQNADMVITPFVEHVLGEEHSQVVEYPFLPVETAFGFLDVDWAYTIPFHAIFYKTDILKSHGIRFSEHIFYEDTEFSLLPLPYVSVLYYIPTPLYCYNIGRAEQSTSLQHVIAHFEDLRFILCAVFTFYTQHQHDTERRHYYKIRAHNVLNFFFKITLLPEWYKNKALQQKKRSLFKELQKRNKELFFSFMNQSLLKRMQYVCDYRLDGLFIGIKNVLKRNMKKGTQRGKGF